MNQNNNQSDICQEEIRILTENDDDKKDDKHVVVVLVEDIQLIKKDYLQTDKEKIARLNAIIRFTENKTKQSEAISEVKSMVTRSYNPPVQELVESDILPFLMGLVETSPEDSKLALEVACILGEVAGGQTNHIQYAVGNLKCLPWLIQLLDSKDQKVAQKGILCLGNIAREGNQYRNLVLETNILIKLVAIVEENETSMHNVEYERTIMWTIMNLCGGSPRPDFTFIKPVISSLLQIAKSNTDRDISAHCFWSLAYQTDVSSERTKELLEAGISPVLFKRILKPNLHPSIALAILLCLSNIVDWGQLISPPSNKKADPNATVSPSAMLEKPLNVDGFIRDMIDEGVIDNLLFNLKFPAIVDSLGVAQTSVLNRILAACTDLRMQSLLKMHLFEILLIGCSSSNLGLVHESINALNTLVQRIGHDEVVRTIRVTSFTSIRKLSNYDVVCRTLSNAYQAQEFNLIKCIYQLQMEVPKGGMATFWSVPRLLQYKKLYSALEMTEVVLRLCAAHVVRRLQNLQLPMELIKELKKMLV
jgi:hypothetical protein